MNRSAGFFRLFVGVEFFSTAWPRACVQGGIRFVLNLFAESPASSGKGRGLKPSAINGGKSSPVSPPGMRMPPERGGDK